MNTSHNKDRLIEHGWKNVLKNVVTLPKLHTLCNTNNSNELNNILAQRSRKHTRKKAQHNSNEIFATTSSKKFPESKGYVNLRIIDTIGGEETSSEKRQSYQNPTAIELNVNKLAKTDKWNDFRKKLIFNMFDYIEDEQMYLKQFKQLLAFEEDRKEPNNIPGEIECLENERSLPNQVEQNLVENCRCKGNYCCKSASTSQGFRKGKCKYIDNDENDCFRDNDITPAFVGLFEDRIKMRRNLLNNLRSEYNGNQVYDSLIEQLINLEESFIL